MGDLLDALGKNPATLRRKVAVAVAGALLPVALRLRHPAEPGGPPRRCAAAGRRSWPASGSSRVRASPSRRGTRGVQNAFLHTGKSYAAEVHATVARVLTGYAQSWANMYAGGLRGDADRAASSRRRCSTCACPACRSAWAGCARSPTCSARRTARSSRTRSAPPTRWRSLDRCADVPLLRAVVRPPEDPVTRAKVAELRRRLAELKARSDAGRWKEVLKAAPAAGGGGARDRVPAAASRRRWRW